MAAASTRIRGFIAITAVITILAVLAGAPVAGADGGVLPILVTNAGGAPVPGASVTLGEATATTDGVGRAELHGVVPGSVVVAHPRFETRTVEWSGEGDRLRVALGGPALRALHISGSMPGTARWNSMLDLADRTALNAVMLDMKDESGFVYAGWSGSAPAPVGLDYWDLAGVAAEVHGRGLDLIVRIVAFQDPRFAAVAPYAAVHNTATGGPFTRRGQTFLDPTDEAAQRYVRELAVSACAAGVDEVQLDYIRFPDGMTPSLRFDHVDSSSESQRVAAITNFIAGLRAELPTTCALAADIFGFITSIPGDGGIGQDLDVLAPVIDVLSPMVYPNHWGRGWFGYSVPADHPGGVVTQSMSDALARLGGSVTLRPWLQDFGGYGAAEVRAQIDAADALGLGWMIWNAGSQYTEAAIPTDAEVRTPTELPEPVVEFLPSAGFWDVPDVHTFSGDIEWLGAEGITRGCNPPWRDEFCPERPVTRAEAATFLVRALELPASDVDRFVDDNGTTHEAAINALAAAGITRGCTPETYCPHEYLTRAQMASLIARALALPAAAGSDRFDDDNHSTHEPDIERIAAAGITYGCHTTLYCPEATVTRGQVAAFLHRAMT